MSDTKTRRTIALPDGSKDHLATIKSETGIPTDVAVIAEALRLRARLATETPEDIINAVRVCNYVRNNAQSKDGVELLFQALNRPAGELSSVILP